MNHLLDGEVTSIIHTISFIHEWLDQALRDKLKDIGEGDITSSYAPSFHCLRMAGGSLPITQLAEQMHRSKPYVTYMVNHLQKGGYFSRSKDNDDRRVNCVILTDKGMEAAELIDDIVAQTTREKLDTFTNEERQLLSILLNKVSRSL